MNESPKTSASTIVLLAVIAASAVMAGFYFSLKMERRNQQQSSIPGLFWPNPRQLTAFETLDNKGNNFGLNNLNGKWSFLFFGYTNCPDICPVTLYVLAQVYPSLQSASKDVQVIFVSVDPSRDSTGILDQYVSYFHQDFIGLSGAQQQIDDFTQKMGVVYMLNNNDNQENYLVDHAASIFLIDPKGRMVAKISPPHQIDAISRQFQQIKEFIDAG